MGYIDHPKGVTMNAYYNMHCHNAWRRNWTPLSKEMWESVVQQPCHYCGGIDTRNIAKQACYTSKRKTDKRLRQVEDYDIEINGVDRVDNDIRYTPENVVSCCGACNLMKSDLSKEQFIDHLKRIYKCQHS